MKIFIIMLMVVSSYAYDIKKNMLNLYENKKFKEVCNIGFNNFNSNMNDEEYVSLYAFACLNVDYLDRLPIAITALRSSNESRSNASYFSIIYMQKKLLYHALLDNYDLKSLNLPTTDYVLSKVFDLFIKLDNHKQQYYLLKDEKDNRVGYKLYIIKDKYLDKIVIEELYDSRTIAQHIYW